MKRWGILILWRRWCSLRGEVKWRCGWMRTWLKITPITIKTVPKTLPMIARTLKSNIKIFMVLKLTWSANLSFWFRKTQINMNKWETHNINFSPNFYKTKIFSINSLFSILSKSIITTFFKIIFIVLNTWNQFLSCSHLRKIIKIQPIINLVMSIKSLLNIWHKWKKTFIQWKPYLKTKNLRHKVKLFCNITKILLKSFINLKLLHISFPILKIHNFIKIWVFHHILIK